MKNFPSFCLWGLIVASFVFPSALQASSCVDVTVAFKITTNATRIKTGVGGFTTFTNIYRTRKHTYTSVITANNGDAYGGSYNFSDVQILNYPADNYTIWEEEEPDEDGCKLTVPVIVSWVGTETFTGHCYGPTNSCTALLALGVASTNCDPIFDPWFTCVSSTWGAQWEPPEITQETYFKHETVISNSNLGFSRTISQIELSDFYSTDLLIQKTREAARLSNYQTQWQASGTAELSVTAIQRCANAWKMKVKFSLQTEKDVDYEIHWDKVTTNYWSATSTRSTTTTFIAGTGLLEEREIEILPPLKPGRITVENVWAEIAGANSGGPPGSGGPSFAQGGGSGCSGCGKGDGHEGGHLSGEASFEFAMGKSAFGGAAGNLSMFAPSAHESLGTPSMLEYNGGRPDVEVVRPFGDIRQIKAPQALADVITNSPYKFEVRFFLTNQVGSADGNGIYSVAGQTPYVVWTVENPDTTNAFNKWRIIETRDGTSRTNLYVYTSGTLTWKLTSPGNLREDELKVENDSGNGTRTETSWVRKPGGSDLEKVKRIYKTFSWGEGLVAEHVGSDSDPHITTNIFSTSGTANGTRRPLEKTIYPSGAWEKYQYDTYGRLTNTVSQFLNFSESAGENYHRVTAVSYDAVGGSSGDQSTIQTNTARTTIHKLRGQEIGRSYKIFRTGGEELDIVCPIPVSDWNNTNNIVTVTKRYTTSANSNRVSSIKRPDGTMSFFDYTDTATNRTTIETSGQPDELELAILNGTETVTVINWVGEMVSRTDRAIINGSANIVLSRQMWSDYDQYNRPRKMTYIDGSFTWTDHGACCGTTSETNREGALIEYFRDDLQRIVATKTLGITTSNILDAAGRTVALVRRGTDNSLITLKSARYDLAGHMTFETNALGGVTAFTEGFASGQPVKTNTYPDGGVRIETYFIDGQLEKVIGSAAHPVRYTHGIESDGVWRPYTTEYKLDTNGVDTAEWSKTLSDGAGRSYKTVFAGDGSPYEQSWFNSENQLWKQRDPDSVITLRFYNPQGELAYTAIDSNRNDTIFGGSDGLDRITQSTNDVTTRGSVDVQRTRTYVWETPNSSTATLMSTIEVSTNGLSTWRTGPNGTSSTVISSPPCGTKTITETAPDNSYSISLYHTGRLVSVTRYDSTPTEIGKTSYGYDIHGRQNTITDSRNGTTTYTFNNADQVVSVTTPPPGNGQPAQTTTTFYNKMLQATNTMQPDGTSVTYEHFQTGLRKKISGSRQYTVAYTYDAQGRLNTMSTWTNVASGNSAVTIWTYNERGLLTNKAYAGGLVPGPDYTYTAAGKLATRTWTRGSPRISATHSYNHAGDLAAVDYSDATLDLTYGYDRRGRLTSIVQGSSVYTTTLGYNLAGQIISDSFNGQAITNGYDSLLRRTAVGLSGSSATLVKYGYDPASRLAVVTNDVNVANYSYVANSRLMGEITFKNNGTTRMTTTKSWDKLNRLQSINSVAASTIGSAYTYNSANQRTRNNQADGSHWNYEYDKLGQVISGKKYWSDGTPVEGQQFEYSFDDIGNRRGARMGGDSSGSNLRTATYTPNNLNQYTSRTLPAYIDVIGAADARSTVTVNGQSTHRKGEFYRNESSISNGSTNVYQAITNTATFGSTNETITGHIFVPQTPENFFYDADGNLTNDGRWFYTWDAQNRLTQMIATNVVDGARRKIDFEYDYKWRRVRKTSFHPNGSGWVVTNDLKFVYDGWNLVAELNATNSAVVRSYVWGSDLGGTMQGAGGVGGLISMTVHTGAEAGTYFYAYDGNANIVALVNAANGSIAARYEYDPFHNVIRATAPLASINPFLGATKFYDWETGFYYYGYRYYVPSIGRWTNRDPIEENGGQNLFAFIQNDGIAKIDRLGLTWWGNPQEWPIAPPRSCQYFKARCKITVTTALRGSRLFDMDHNDGAPTEDRNYFMGCFWLEQDFEEECPCREKATWKFYNHLGCWQGMFINNSQTIANPFTAMRNTTSCQNIANGGLGTRMQTYLQNLYNAIQPIGANPTIYPQPLPQIPY